MNPDETAKKAKEESELIDFVNKNKNSLIDEINRLQYVEELYKREKILRSSEVIKLHQLEQENARLREAMEKSIKILSQYFCHYGDARKILENALRKSDAEVKEIEMSGRLNSIDKQHSSDSQEGKKVGRCK